MSIRMNELERADHIERESLREEINRNRQEVGRSEKRFKERLDEHIAKNLSRMTLGTLDTKIDAMMERRTQEIMDRLDGLLGSKSGPKEGEPKVNFNDHQKRRTYGSTRGRGSSSGYATRDISHGARTVEQVQRGTDRPLTNDQRKAHMRLGEVIPVTGDTRSQGGVMWAGGGGHSRRFGLQDCTEYRVLNKV